MFPDGERRYLYPKLPSAPSFYLYFWEAKKMVSTLVVKEEMYVVYVRGKTYRIFMSRGVQGLNIIFPICPIPPNPEMNVYSCACFTI